MSYQKLVRDKIPEIIERNGERPITRVLSDKEFLQELNKKLKEECEEYLSSGEVEELADLEEVLRAIVKAKGVDYNIFEELRLKKVDKRGAFENKIYLEGIENEK